MQETMSYKRIEESAKIGNDGIAKNKSNSELDESKKLGNHELARNQVIEQIRNGQKDRGRRNREESSYTAG